MDFCLANKEDLPAVLVLYRSVLGLETSTWNEYYPSMEEIENDYTHNCLYLLKEGASLCGAISIVPDDELGELDCWIEREHTAELSRVVVCPDKQGRGLSKLLVHKAEGILRSRSCKAVHLLAAVKNIPACRCYASCGYLFHRQVEMYNDTYYACEKQL